MVSSVLQILTHLISLFFQKSDPVVSYKESIANRSDMMCLSKSPNKHNRLFCQAQPLGEDFSTMIDDGTITPRQEPKARAK